MAVLQYTSTRTNCRRNQASFMAASSGVDLVTLGICWIKLSAVGLSWALSLLVLLVLVLRLLPALLPVLSSSWSGFVLALELLLPRSPVCEGLFLKVEARGLAPVPNKQLK